MKLDKFTYCYIRTALWSSTCETPNGEDVPMDNFFSIERIHPDTLSVMIADCKNFQDKNCDMISSDVSQAGHDFWLTRNHHGTGFWDGEWKDGKFLTESAHSYGEFYLYVGDEEYPKIHGSK